MLAVHLEKRRVTLRNVRKPEQRKGFALIRMLCAGICRTDLELLRGYYDFRGTPGHEFAGEVVAADSADLVGRRVVGEINLPCRKCDWCRRGLGRHCPRRDVLGIVRHAGAFREFLTLPEANLHLIPDSVSNEEAVFVEPLAAACEILDQSSIPDSATVAVLGDGKLGLLVAQVLNATGKEAHLYGHHRAKLRIADRVGVTTVLARRKLPQAAYDWLVDATGSTEGLRAAIGMTRPRGTVFMKTTIHGSINIDSAPVVVNELTLIGSRCGRFEPALELIGSGKVKVMDMVTDAMPLAHASRAFALAAQREALKVLFNTAC